MLVQKAWRRALLLLTISTSAAISGSAFAETGGDLDARYSLGGSLVLDQTIVLGSKVIQATDTLRDLNDPKRVESHTSEIPLDQVALREHDPSPAATGQYWTATLACKSKSCIKQYGFTPLPDGDPLKGQSDDIVNEATLYFPSRATAVAFLDKNLNQSFEDLIRESIPDKAAAAPGPARTDEALIVDSAVSRSGGVTHIALRAGNRSETEIYRVTGYRIYGCSGISAAFCRQVICALDIRPGHTVRLETIIPALIDPDGTEAPVHFRFDWSAVNLGTGKTATGSGQVDLVRKGADAAPPGETVRVGGVTYVRGREPRALGPR